MGIRRPYTSEEVRVLTVRDPLDMFNNPDTDTKDYPGNTIPRNRKGGEIPPKNDKVVFLNEMPSKLYIVGGVTQQCYTIGAVSKVLGRKPVTIRSWEIKGWLPHPKIRTRPPEGATLGGKPVKGRRLYTFDQVVYLIEAFDQFRLDVPNTADWTGFIQHLKQYPNT